MERFGTISDEPEWEPRYNIARRSQSLSSDIIRKSQSENSRRCAGDWFHRGQRTPSELPV
jgi:hypothetical protein